MKKEHEHQLSSANKKISFFLSYIFIFTKILISGFLFCLFLLPKSKQTIDHVLQVFLSAGLLELLYPSECIEIGRARPLTWSSETHIIHQHIITV